MKLFDFLQLDEIPKEDDLPVEDYCRSCFKKKRKRERFFFYASEGPFCSANCFADFIGTERENLPPIVYKGKLSESGT